MNTGNLDLSLVSFVATTGAVIPFLHLSFLVASFVFFAVLLSSGMCFTFPSSIHPSNHFGIHIYALLFKGCGNTRLSGSCNTLSAEQVRSSSAESGDFAARWQHLSKSISIVCSYISDYCGITVSPKQTNHQDHHQDSNSLARALRSCYHPNALITSF